MNATSTNLIPEQFAVSEEVELLEIIAKYSTNEIKLYFQVTFPLALASLLLKFPNIFVDPACRLIIINRYFQSGTMIASSNCTLKTDDIRRHPPPLLIEVVESSVSLIMLISVDRHSTKLTLRSSGLSVCVAG